MTRIGVICNPFSRRNRPGGLAIADSLARNPNVLRTRIGDVVEIPEVVAEFARREVGVIVIDGGDGTLQAALTAALLGSGFAAPPRFALIASGNTNLTARDVGIGGSRRSAIDRLVACLAAGRIERATVTRPAIRMERGGDQPPVLGMFFGFAAMYHMTEVTRRRIEAKGILHGGAAGMGIALALARILLAGEEDALAAGEPLGLAVDDAPLRNGHRLLMLSTTLERLVFGLRPFWGEGEGGLRYLDIAAPPRRFAPALLPVLRGRPRPWMAGAGYASGRAKRLRLALASPYLLDGQIFAPEPGRDLVLTAGPDVAFVRP